MQRAAKTLTSQAIKTAHIDIPATVQVARQAEQLIFTGPLGVTRLGLSKVDPDGCAARKLLPDQRHIAVCSISKPFFGTLTSLIKNKIHGVTQGYLVYLRIQGIGYRASINGAHVCNNSIATQQCWQDSQCGNVLASGSIKAWRTSNQGIEAYSGPLSFLLVQTAHATAVYDLYSWL